MLARQFGVSLTTLRSALNLLIEEGYLRSQHGLGTYVTIPDNARLSALVVDDDHDVVRLMHSILEGEDVDVYDAVSGRQAIEKVGDREFDIIFLDLVMPEGDGVQTLGRFREMRLETPVVDVTGEADANMISRAMAYGPLTLIIKPVRPEQVRQLLRSMYPERRR
jgi:DNA-binding NtrC family response regulator